MRVYELARVLNVQSRDVLAGLRAAGIKDRRTASSGLTAGECDAVRSQIVGQAGKVIDFDGRTGTGKVRLDQGGGVYLDVDFDMKSTKLLSSHYEPITAGKSVKAKVAGGKVDALSVE